MHDNKDVIAHLPIYFMAKIHQLFRYLASFSHNSINTNKVEIGELDLETKQIIQSLLLKMLEHIDDNSIPQNLCQSLKLKMLEHMDRNSIPQNIPAFAKSLFVEAPKAGLPTNPALPRPSNKVLTRSVPLPTKAEGTSCMVATTQVLRSQGRNFWIGASRWGFSTLGRKLPIIKLSLIAPSSRTALEFATISTPMGINAPFPISSARLVNISLIGSTSQMMTRSPF